MDRIRSIYRDIGDGLCYGIEITALLPFPNTDPKNPPAVRPREIRFPQFGKVSHLSYLEGQVLLDQSGMMWYVCSLFPVTNRKNKVQVIMQESRIPHRVTQKQEGPGFIGEYVQYPSMSWDGIPQ